MASPFRLAKSVARLLLLLLLFCVPAARAEQVKNLKPQGYVNDFAGVLSAQAKEKLTALCAEVDQKAKAQIAIVTVSSLEGEPVEQFSIDLATAWGIGPKQTRPRHPDSAGAQRPQGSHRGWLRAGADLARRQSGRLRARSGAAVAAKRLQRRRPSHHRACRSGHCRRSKSHAGYSSRRPCSRARTRNRTILPHLLGISPRFSFSRFLFFSR